MICVSINEERLEDLLAALEDVDFAEVRLERMRPGIEELRAILAKGKRIIATMRPGTVSDSVRAQTLINAIELGADYVDVEVYSESSFHEPVIVAASLFGCRVIASFHNFEGMPSKDRLAKIVDDCFEMGCDIAKVACRAKTPADCARLLGLLDGGRPVIPIGMGEIGRVTRVAAPLLGSPFTFAALAKGKETALGQYDAPTLRRIFREMRNE